MLPQEIEIEVDAPAEETRALLKEVGRWKTRVRELKEDFQGTTALERMGLIHKPNLSARVTQHDFKLEVIRLYRAGSAVISGDVHPTAQGRSKIVARVRPTAQTIVFVVLLLAVAVQGLAMLDERAGWLLSVISLVALALQFGMYRSNQRLLVDLLIERVKQR